MYIHVTYTYIYIFIHTFIHIYIYIYNPQAKCPVLGRDDVSHCSFQLCPTEWLTVSL